jgi:LPS O-antigen subunit length determinant protein (WzzB/FepE family)
MSSESEALDKAKEAAAEAKERRHLAPVSLTIAILAVFVAIVSLLGHRAHTEEILMQTRATDQWGYYQAKNMRLNNLQALDEVLTAVENTKAERAQEVQKHFHEEIDKYSEQKKDIEVEAREFEAEVQRATRRADRFDLGEVFLEIALVITSITLLTDNRRYWYCGIVLAVIGVVAAGSGLLVH